MAADNRSRRLAVLIDADNTSSKIADGLFEYVAGLGQASVRRIYGDFSSPRAKGWADTLMRHAIIPQQQFAYTTGKNSSDIALVIDAMDLLFSERVDGFCLVTSDGDFARLAARIREHGVDVFGFGEKRAPECFRQACQEFVFTESLVSDAVPDRKQKASTSSRIGDPAKPSSPSKTAIDAIPLLEKILSIMKGNDGWVPLAELGSQLSNSKPDFDSRTYGSSKLSGLVRETGAFEIKHAGKAIQVRLKKLET
ncbi:MAG: NYN domain-containing protein [Rhizobium sp.]|nr:NYN domain-containing protein [Rhizobium sp.]